MSIPIDNRHFSISVSVVLYENPVEEIDKFLTSIWIAYRHLQTNSGYHFDIDITLVNNGSTSIRDWYLKTVKQSECYRSLGIEIEEGHGNIGYGGGINLGLNGSDSDFYLLMNPDVSLEPSSLTEGLKYLLSNDRVQAVSPFCVNPCGEQQYLCKNYPSIFDLFLRGFGSLKVKALFADRLAEYERRDLGTVKPRDDVCIISGCFMLCRSEAFKSVGGFNSDYFLYFEDFDLSLRLKQKGDLAFVPTMRISHRGGNAANKNWLHLRYFMVSAIRFFSSHGWKWV